MKNPLTYVSPTQHNITNITFQMLSHTKNNNKKNIY